MLADLTGGSMLGGGARTAIILVAFMLVIGLSGLTRKKKAASHALQRVPEIRLIERAAQKKRKEEKSEPSRLKRRQPYMPAYLYIYPVFFLL